jgi:hypothetical protein
MKPISGLYRAKDVKTFNKIPLNISSLISYSIKYYITLALVYYVFCFILFKCKYTCPKYSSSWLGYSTDDYNSS